MLELNSFESGNVYFSEVQRTLVSLLKMFLLCRIHKAYSELSEAHHLQRSSHNYPQAFHLECRNQACHTKMGKLEAWSDVSVSFHLQKHVILFNPLCQTSQNGIFRILQCQISYWFSKSPKLNIFNLQEVFRTFQLNFLDLFNCLVSKAKYL